MMDFEQFRRMVEQNATLISQGRTSYEKPCNFATYSSQDITLANLALGQIDTALEAIRRGRLEPVGALAMKVRPRDSDVEQMRVLMIDPRNRGSVQFLVNVANQLDRLSKVGGRQNAARNFIDWLLLDVEGDLVTGSGGIYE